MATGRFSGGLDARWLFASFRPPSPPPKSQVIEIIEVEEVGSPIAEPLSRPEAISSAECGEVVVEGQNETSPEAAGLPPPPSMGPAVLPDTPPRVTEKSIAKSPRKRQNASSAPKGTSIMVQLRKENLSRVTHRPRPSSPPSLSRSRNERAAAAAMLRIGDSRILPRTYVESAHDSMQEFMKTGVDSLLPAGPRGLLLDVHRSLNAATRIIAVNVSSGDPPL